MGPIAGGTPPPARRSSSAPATGHGGCNPDRPDRWQDPPWLLAVPGPPTCASLSAVCTGRRRRQALTCGQARGLSPCLPSLPAGSFLHDNGQWDGFLASSLIVFRCVMRSRPSDVFHPPCLSTLFIHACVLTVYPPAFMLYVVYLPIVGLPGPSMGCAFYEKMRKKWVDDTVKKTRWQATLGDY
ncbi:hypothetical protein BS78_01G099000 [Paspalum vaginatum]|nr:hypothetical protein BS78_01G099000 [Paspalum vaginatum]